MQSSPGGALLGSCGNQTESLSVWNNLPARKIPTCCICEWTVCCVVLVASDARTALSLFTIYYYIIYLYIILFA